jgi:hydroxymethylglutaryl-CoA lyase
VLRIDSSAGGIGGCPFAPASTGNIATGDLVYMLDRSGIRSGYDPAALRALASWLAGTLRLEALPAMMSRAGQFPESEVQRTTFSRPS